MAKIVNLLLHKKENDKKPVGSIGNEDLAWVMLFCSKVASTLDNPCLNLGKAHSTPHFAQYSHLDRLQAEKFH